LQKIFSKLLFLKYHSNKIYIIISITFLHSHLFEYTKFLTSVATFYSPWQRTSKSWKAPHVIYEIFCLSATRLWKPSRAAPLIRNFHNAISLSNFLLPSPSTYTCTLALGKRIIITLLITITRRINVLLLLTTAPGKR